MTKARPKPRLLLVTGMSGAGKSTAARALARVTGRVGVEDVLDGLFARFCIGK